MQIVWVGLDLNTTSPTQRLQYYLISSAWKSVKKKREIKMKLITLLELCAFISLLDKAHTCREANS